MFNQNNDYLNKFSEALQLCAFAGDTRNAKILWLSSFTRHSNTPVSVLIKGSPGSGKSHLLNTVLKFIPEDEYKSFTGISEKAIAYMGKYTLKNKILAIQEFSGLQNQEGNTLLRSLLSENKIHYQTVVNDANNKFTTQQASMEGPVALFMTTTEKSIHPEDENNDNKNDSKNKSPATQGIRLVLSTMGTFIRSVGYFFSAFWAVYEGHRQSLWNLNWTSSRF